MVHILASFEKIHQCVFEVVRKLNGTDGRGGLAISPVPGPTARHEIIKPILEIGIIYTIGYDCIPCNLPFMLAFVDPILVALIY